MSRAITAPHVGLRRSGLLIAGLAGAGLLISIYLTAVKLSGGTPVCGPFAGCDTVNSSIYSQFMGVPVAIFGAVGSAAVLFGALAWWRNGWRPGLLLAYVVGLASLPAVAYLTYLELFVIGAVCVWCVAYAATVVLAWLVSLRAMSRRAGAPGTPEAG